MDSYRVLIQDEFAKLSPNYFNSAYFGPIPLRAQKKGYAAIDREANPFSLPYDEWRELPDQLRQQLGQLLGVPGESVSHHCSTSEVISLLSLGFPFKTGEAVVVMDGEYPSDVLPWMLNEKRSAYRLHRLSPHVFEEIDLLAAHLPEGTRVINMSHVMFNTGRMLDVLELGEFCRSRDIFFVVDVTQSFGGVSLSAEMLAVCDVVVGSSYKWLLGPYGHAFAYWSDRALELVTNIHLTWQTAINAKGVGQLLNYTTEPLPGARRFDRGQAPNFIGMNVLSGSLELLAQIGLDKIETHNTSLVDHFFENFPRDRYELVTPENNRSNIVCLKKSNGDSGQLVEKLQSAGIDASVREGHLRLAFHIFNTLSEVESLIEALGEVASPFFRRVPDAT